MKGCVHERNALKVIERPDLSSHEVMKENLPRKLQDRRGRSFFLSFFLDVKKQMKT